VTAEKSLEQRIAAVEARLAIGQLPIRYAIAVDSRDLDGWVATFVEDVDCGRHGRGREALKRYIEPQLRGFYRSIHFICGHQIDLIDADRAEGRVYCRAEHEDGGKWIVMGICYFDTYERRDGEWFFLRRNEEHWYSSDVLERPHAPDFQHWPRHEKQKPRLPAILPTWQAFWDADPAVANLTDAP
jgi:hypothetical protein